MIFLPILKDLEGELFINLNRNCGNNLFPFKIIKGMSPPDGFASTNVEITSRTSLGVTGRKEKVLTIMNLLLIFFILMWFSYLLKIRLFWSG